MKAKFAASFSCKEKFGIRQVVLAGRLGY